jgi:hypothetical protein
MVIGGDPVLPLPVTGDHSHRIRLDYQVLREALDLFGGAMRGLLVVIANGDQVSHVVLLRARVYGPVVAIGRTDPPANR